MREVLGIKFSNQSLADLVAEISTNLEQGIATYAVTPNPEIVLGAQKDEQLKAVINQANYSLADGFGVKLVLGLSGKRLKRVTGSDLTLHLLQLAHKKNIPIALLLWEKGLTSETELAKALRSKYPQLNYLILNAQKEKTLSKENQAKITDFGAKMLLIALGSPEQELMSASSIASVPTLLFSIGIGGSLDFVSGQAKRAPRGLRLLGLEWLWRLILQPKRIVRIYRAVIVFPFKVLLAKLSVNK